VHQKDTTFTYAQVAKQRNLNWVGQSWVRQSVKQIHIDYLSYLKFKPVGLRDSNQLLTSRIFVKLMYANPSYFNISDSSIIINVAIED
jgi:hypothetical protein